MNDLIPFLKSLLSTSGLSGYETPVREIILAAWRPLVDEVAVSPLGSLHALRHGTAPNPRPRLLLSAHMDAIGLMVTGVSNGFLHFNSIGGVDARILPGLEVIVHGREDLPGVICQPSAFLLPPGIGSNPVGMEYLWIDTGLLPEKVASRVRVGDRISFGQPPIQLGNDFLAGHSLDNRASVAAVTICLQELQDRSHAWDVWAVASTQEEVSLGGAQTSSFHARPDLAVAIDVTFGKGVMVDDYRTHPLGKGLALGWGANIHPALYKTFKELADRLEIPNRMEPMPSHSGTDAIAIQTVAEGIPCMVVSIPLRNMHTSTEVVSIKDIQRTGRLLAEFITGLAPDYVQKITWED
jgi:tetrahedral aminopeptidase